MPELAYTSSEIMTIAAARMLRDRMVCFVGIGMPSAAANLARLTHAPEVVLIYESGTIGSKPGSGRSSCNTCSIVLPANSLMEMTRKRC